MKLSIIICVYNEINTISEIIKKVQSQTLINNIKKEIIIIDNNSTDGTREALKELVNTENLKIIFNKINIGKGGSIKKGIRESSGELIIFQDADLEYDPSEYNKLLKCLLTNKLDAVYGSRYLGGKDFHVYKLNRFAVFFLTFVINILFKTSFTDSATNYKLIKSDTIRYINFISKSFSIDFEITLHLGLLSANCSEVPIEYNPRKYLDGKKINYKDAFKSVYIILYYFIKYKILRQNIKLITKD
jgi:glycosyltransferase involved in cell wall biosynthesis